MNKDHEEILTKVQERISVDKIKFDEEKAELEIRKQKRLNHRKELTINAIIKNPDDKDKILARYDEFVKEIEHPTPFPLWKTILVWLSVIFVFILILPFILLYSVLKSSSKA